MNPETTAQLGFLFIVCAFTLAGLVLAAAATCAAILGDGKARD
jgi:hypothetical protein